MSLKRSGVDPTRWSIILVFLWTLTEVKGYPCADVPCIHTSQVKDGSVLNLTSRLTTVLSKQGSITQDKVDVRNETKDFTPTIKDAINKELGFFDNISKQPLKIILVIGLSLVLLTISIVIGRRCYQCYHSLSVKNQAYATIIRIGKSQHMS